MKRGLCKEVEYTQGHREGWQGGAMTPGPMDFRGPMGFSGSSRGPMSSRGARRNDTEKLACEAWRPFFFWRSHHNSDKTAAFSPSVLEFTKPKICHISAGPGPTFGSRRPWVYVTHRRVARIWKRGGYFERVRKVQTTLTRIFIVLESVSHGLSENWDEISRELGNSKVFSARNQVVSKKKRKKKVFAEIETDFSAEIRNSKVFSAQNQVVSKKKKKKKRSSPKLRLIFRPKSEIQRFLPPKIRWSPKKKKSSPKLRLIFRPKSDIQRFFPPKIRWSPKKKGSSPKLRLIFRPKSEIQRFLPPKIR